MLLLFYHKLVFNTKAMLAVYIVSIYRSVLMNILSWINLITINSFFFLLRFFLEVFHFSFFHFLLKLYFSLGWWLYLKLFLILRTLNCSRETRLWSKLLSKNIISIWRLNEILPLILIMNYTENLWCWLIRCATSYDWEIFSNSIRVRLDIMLLENIEIYPLFSLTSHWRNIKTLNFTNSYFLRVFKLIRGLSETSSILNTVLKSDVIDLFRYLE